MRAETTADMDALLAHAGWVRRFARALVQDADEAEDLAQDTLLRAWRHPAREGGRGWLARVARNLAVDRFRGETRRKRREAAACGPETGRVSTPEELIGDGQIHRRVAETVASLAEPFRQTIVLRFYQGLSSADIARHLGVPEGTIRWRVKEGLERARRALDARHGNERSAWMAALGPLLPKPLPHEARSRPRPARTASGFPTAAYLTLAAIGILSLATIAIVARAPRSRAGGPAAETALPTAGTGRPTRPLPSVRLNLASQHGPSQDADTVLPPGPGRADAQSLAEELLRAIQGADYDAFVAKGSASFRAAVATARFASLSTKLGGRLSQGHSVSTLGSVRRPRTTDWFFKVEFADGRDDALVTLAMDGWQVAGFLINEPIPMPAETAP